MGPAPGDVGATMLVCLLQAGVQARMWGTDHGDQLGLLLLWPRR